MSGHECYHCKQWVEEGEAHDCWTTTKAALTADLSVDLQEAWERLREAAAEFGDRRIYASHNAIMFARKSCYFFLRPEADVPRSVRLPWPRRQGPRTCAVWTGCRSPSCGTRFPSATGTRWSRPSPTGWERLTSSTARRPRRTHRRAPDPGCSPEIVARGSDAGLRRGHPNQPTKIRSLQRLPDRSKSSAFGCAARTLTNSTSRRASSSCDAGPRARDLNRRSCSTRLELVAGCRLSDRVPTAASRAVQGWPPETGASGPPRKRMATSAYHGPHDGHRPAAHSAHGQGTDPQDPSRRSAWDQGRGYRGYVATWLRKRSANRYGRGSGPTGRCRCRRPAPVDVPCAGRTPGPDRLAVRRCLPDCRSAGYRQDRTVIWLSGSLATGYLATSTQTLSEPSRHCGVYRGMLSPSVHVNVCIFNHL